MKVVRAALLVAALGVVLTPKRAHAEDRIAPWRDGSSQVERAPEELPERSSTASDLSPTHKLGAVLTAIGPGAAFHGLGHVAAGDRKTGEHLLAAEGIGLGLTAGGLAGLAVTGASRYTVVPFALTTIVGATIFLGAYLADIYGVSAPTVRGAPATVAPRLESEGGLRYIYDPQFRYRSFFVESIDARIGRLRIAPSAWLSLNDRNRRFRGVLGWRFWGPLADGPAWSDGSFTDAEIAATRHDFKSDGFSLTTFEAMFSIRRDLAKLEPALAGSFVELGMGFGLEIIDYDVPGTDVPSDVEQLLLARAAYGFYMGTPDREGGEMMLYYDHRHDDYAAGLQMTGLGSGVVGHFGWVTRYFFESGIGFVAEAQVGSAYIVGASLAYRTGGGR